MRRTLASISIAAAAVLAICAAARSGDAPATLVRLEREVSLQLAHQRDLGPTDPYKRKHLSQANQLDQQGEAALKAGDYTTAGDRLQAAQKILRRLGD